MSGGPAASGGGGGSGGRWLTCQRRGLPQGQAFVPPRGLGATLGPAPADRPMNPPASSRPDTSSGTFLIFVRETVIFEVKLIFLKAQVLSGDMRSSSFNC